MCTQLPEGHGTCGGDVEGVDLVFHRDDDAQVAGLDGCAIQAVALASQNQGEPSLVLRQDPRPAYTRDTDENRMFWLAYDDFVIWFTVQERCLRVVDATKASPQDIAYMRETGNVPDDWARA